MKLHEKSEEAEKDKEGNESASPDTTSQHKNHLFDLNCKICIGDKNLNIFLPRLQTKMWQQSFTYFIRGTILKW